MVENNRISLSRDRLPVAAARQSAAIRGHDCQGRSTEPPLRQGSGPQCAPKPASTLALNLQGRKQNLRCGWVLTAVCLFCGAWTHAAVFPIATNTAVIETASSVASDGTNCLIGVLSSTNVTVQLVSASGTRLGSPTTVGASLSTPLVAFGSNRYLVVWADSTTQSGVDLLGQFIDRTGARVGSTFGLLPAAGFYGFQKPRALASDGTNYLAVWSEDANILYGQIIGPAGTVLASEIQLSGSPAVGAGVAFDGRNFLVAFQYQTSDSPEQWNTHGTFVSPSGTAGIPFLISETPSAIGDGSIAIAFGRTNYIVAWERNGGSPTTPAWDVYARFVDALGNLIGNETAMVNSPGDQRFPGLAYDGGNYLLSWIDAFGTTNANARFQFIDMAGQPKAPAFTVLFTTQSNAPVNGTLLYNGNQYATIATLGYPGTSVADVYGAFIPSSIAPPRLDNPRLSANGAFRFRLNGITGTSYTIQVLTNVECHRIFCITDPCPPPACSGSWQTIFTTNAPSDSFDVVDPGSTNFTYRVYRAVGQ